MQLLQSKVNTKTTSDSTKRMLRLSSADQPVSQITLVFSGISRGTSKSIQKGPKRRKVPSVPRARSSPGGPPRGTSPGGTSPGGLPEVPPGASKKLQKSFKRLQIKPGPAKWRDLGQISPFSTTWLDLEPFEVPLKPF